MTATTNPAICRYMCSAAEICWECGCAPPISTLRPAACERSGALSDRLDSIAARGTSSGCSPITERRRDACASIAEVSMGDVRPTGWAVVDFQTRQGALLETSNRRRIWCNGRELRRSVWK